MSITHSTHIANILNPESRISELKKELPSNTDRPMNTERETEIINMIKSVCKAKRELLKDRRVILFGSRARQQNKNHADFDIGILGKKPLRITDLCILKDALYELPTLYTIDLVDFNRVSESFRNEALKYHSVLYA